MSELADAVRRAKRVYVIGNGGSYANAMHIVNDLIACTVRAQTIDPSTLTALSNDYGYDVALEMWLRVMGEPGDLLIALSGSGKSPNIVRAMACAEDIGMDTHLVTNFLRSMDMQASEEAQIRLGHDLWRELRK